VGQAEHGVPKLIFVTQLLEVTSQRQPAKSAQVQAVVNSGQFIEAQWSCSAQR
jgi:hypothetical protein